MSSLRVYSPTPDNIGIYVVTSDWGLGRREWGNHDHKETRRDKKQQKMYNAQQFRLNTPRVIYTEGIISRTCARLST